MKSRVTFRHMKPSEPIREYVDEKVGKLDKLLDENNCEAHVVLSVEKLEQLAHLELIIGGALRVRADERSENMYSSIDLAVDKLVKQVKRYRSKVRDLHRSDTKAWEIPYQVLHLPKSGDEEAPTFESPQVVRTETMVAKEMNRDDALVQMDLLNSDFLVFTDAKSQQLNVMYRLPDGQYGLIEARPSP